MDFLNELNDSQKKSVEHISSPLMVIAGAGSGKTRVLTYKIAYLIKQGWEPYSILALTFTNKAAEEMKERIAKIVGPAYAKKVWMGTFHSVFAKILRKEAEKIGYTSSFTIYDTDDSKKILTDIIKRMQLDEKNIYKPSNILSRISSLKDKLISPGKYETMTHLLIQDKQQKREYFAEIYKAYQKQLIKNGAMDFDDILFNLNVLFRDFPDVLNDYQNKFRYILVDEFQDTNFSQYHAVKQLSSLHQNICVVGDDAQSIYGFRGADINNIVVNFRNDFPTHQLFKLEENYRSTQHIVLASNAIIKKNKHQIPKNVYTNNQKGDPIIFYGCVDEVQEAQTIAEEIKSLNAKGENFSDIAILYRTNAQSRVFEDVFRKHRIPYKIYGGMSFYQRKEIKDILSYFKVVINPKDEEALMRIINFPSRGIGDTTIEKIQNYAYDNQTSAFEIMQNARLLQNELNISNKQVGIIENFITGILNFQYQIHEKDVYILANEIINFSGIIKYYESNLIEENKDRLLNIKELINAIEQFSKSERALPEEDADTVSSEFRTLPEFIGEVSLLTSQDEKNAQKSEPKVSLMTIHLSKGLEFPYVFIAGMEDGLFPSSRSIGFNEIEEERRLFYVALTRAKKRVHLSYAQKRFINGRSNFASPSMFMNELPQELINIQNLSSSFQKHYINEYSDITEQKYSSSQIKTSQPVRKLVSINQSLRQNSLHNNADIIKNKNLMKGDSVYHEKFGKGRILDISGMWPDSKAIVIFENSGQKILLLKFAKLEKI